MIKQQVEPGAVVAMNKMTDHHDNSVFLAVDVGNSAIKIGQFSNVAGDGLPEPLDVIRMDSRSPDFEALQAWIPKTATHCYLASVYRQAAQEIVDWMKSQPTIESVRELRHEDFPLRINVDHPDRVGLDRLASAAAACCLKKNGHAAIVVDAGSAITVDLVSADECFEGGAILAGQQASALALSAGTDLLPVISTYRLDDPPTVVGRATESAIRSGIFWGTVGSIREIVSRMREHLKEDNELFLTGGDMARLAPYVALDGNGYPHLVLSGIALAARVKASSS